MRVGKVLACAALVVAAACGDDPVTPTDNYNTLSASVEGATFTPTTVTAVFSNGRVFIVGSNSTRTLTISVLAPSTPSTLQLQPGNPTNNILVAEGTPPNNPVWSASEVPVDNSVINNFVTFTSISSTAAAGTFGFKAGPVAGTPAINTRTVTNGSFSVKF